MKRRLNKEEKQMQARVQGLEKLWKEGKISQEYFVSKSREILGLRELRRRWK